MFGQSLLVTLTCQMYLQFHKIRVSKLTSHFIVVVKLHPTYVVYFDQTLGAVHPKHWSKYSFSAFFMQKN